jgi:hypothetical protein
MNYLIDVNVGASLEGVLIDEENNLTHVRNISPRIKDAKIIDLAIRGARQLIKR